MRSYPLRKTGQCWRNLRGIGLALRGNRHTIQRGREFRLFNCERMSLVAEGIACGGYVQFGNNGNITSVDHLAGMASLPRWKCKPDTRSSAPLFDSTHAHRLESSRRTHGSRSSCRQTDRRLSSTHKRPKVQYQKVSILLRRLCLAPHAWEPLIGRRHQVNDVVEQGDRAHFMSASRAEHRDKFPA
jgi:hypothetical protein